MTAPRWFLGVDGGATKSVARLVDAQTGQHWSDKGGPGSLSLNFEASTHTLLSLAKYLAKQACCSLKDVRAVLGVAGAGDPLRLVQAQQWLAPHFHSLEITTDARISAFGANQGKPVTVLALGTGSVGYEINTDGSERLFGGWGVLVGDHASGAHMGVTAVRTLLSQYDRQYDSDDPLVHAIYELIGRDRHRIRQWLTQANSTDYATLVPTIRRQEANSPLAAELIAQQIQTTADWIDELPADKPIMVLGSIGQWMIERLPAVHRQRLSESKGSALDGACYLAQYKFTEQPQKGALL